MGIKEIEKLIGEGKKRAEIVKAIREKYKGTGITTAEINSAYKQVNERLEKEAAAKKAIEILEEADKKTEVVNNSSKVEEVEADHEEEFEIVNKISYVLSHSCGCHGKCHYSWVQKTFNSKDDNIIYCYNVETFKRGKYRGKKHYIVYVYELNLDLLSELGLSVKQNTRNFKLYNK